MKHRLLGATALLALIAAPAAAQTGWYGKADAGYSVQGNLDVSPAAAVTTIGPRGKGKTNSAPMGALGLGYGFDNGLRTEFEIANRSSGIKAATNFDRSGGQVWTAMLNGLYDFNRDGGVRPYIGAGVGIGRADFSAFRHKGLAVGAGFDDSDTSFAYQLMAGLGFKFTEQLYGDVGVKYLAIPSLSYNGRTGVSTGRVGGTTTTASTASTASTTTASTTASG
jgi:OmpA-OmpF porin, OOP family